MTPDQVDLIRKSFDAMWSMRGDIADLCYSRFFELAPDAKVLFRSDMERQRVKLMDMVAALVGSLDQRALFQSIVTHSGRQHARFGVRPSHYEALGEALMWSLERKYGASFTPELRASWRALYAMVQVEMLRAGRRRSLSLGTEGSMRPFFCIFGLALAWLITSSAQAHSRGFAWFFANSKPHGTCSGQHIAATFYASGRRTASGQPFNPSGYTAAHRTLPFGSRVTVTNPQNGKSVTVVINDRGPFTRGVTLDLTRGAARAIGMHGTQWLCML